MLLKKHKQAPKTTIKERVLISDLWREKIENKDRQKKEIEDRKKLNIEKRNKKKSQSIQQKNKLTPTNIKQKQLQRSKKNKDEWKMFLEQLQQDSSSDECSEAYESSSDDENVSNDDLRLLCFEKYPPTKKPIKKISWIQCDVCNKWYHKNCLKIPDDAEFNEFTCPRC